LNESHIGHDENEESMKEYEQLDELIKSFGRIVPEVQGIKPERVSIK